MVLRGPETVRATKTGGMLPEERAKFLQSPYVVQLVDGATPVETRSILEGLYELTGASVVAGNRENTDALTSVYRQGEYHGKPVYFTEYFGSDAALGSTMIDTLNVTMSDQPETPSPT
jgi:hypothetical protein